ncbi:unnamed protein product [Aspergillus oryzae RIB40]|uniref:DNA, SC009 n=1 Tax=Aspergillus oryzae (strain ATCC 42149 / RIB 40) TaxID=510516 RepID=Q2UTX6_ASPOR|nr:unnamed protein product [Aspergillus oryzae RIB40]BAE54989.1 unnamed protein product [Aspergillus oryzae RIB40]
MKFLAISSLVAAVSALPSVPAPKAQNDPNAFGVVAARSASPIHFLTLNAANSHFYLGGKAATYCPENIEKLGACPPGKETALLGDKYLQTMANSKSRTSPSPVARASTSTPRAPSPSPLLTPATLPPAPRLRASPTSPARTAPSVAGPTRTASWPAPPPTAPSCPVTPSGRCLLPPTMPPCPPATSETALDSRLLLPHTLDPLLPGSTSKFLV